MLNTVRLVGMWPYNKWTFFKGRTYDAVTATNQPDYLSRGKLFVSKKTGGCILVEKGDYVIVRT